MTSRELLERRCLSGWDRQRSHQELDKVNKVLDRLSGFYWIIWDFVWVAECQQLLEVFIIESHTE